MCHVQPSHKGWLRQRMGQPSSQYVLRFENLVDQWLFGFVNPTDQQIEKARQCSYQQMMGVVA